MFADESFHLINYALADIIKIDYYRLKVLKNLGKLVQEEYRLQNYELANHHAIAYLKVYKRIVREYKGSAYLDTSKTIKKTDEYKMKEVKYLSPKYLDRVLHTYMNCRKFLVGNLVFNIVQDINESLPEHEQWEVFTSYDQIYEADGEYGNSNYRQQLLRRQHKLVDKLIDQYNYLQQIKSGKLYSKILKLE